MLYIYPPKIESAEKPADWAFMEESGKVLDNPPTTWTQYPNTAAGMASIISMEYNELLQAIGQGKSVEAQSQELVHLASACLHYWRFLNHVTE